MIGFQQTQCRLCGKTDVCNEGICGAHSAETAQAYLFGIADGRATVPASPVRSAGKCPECGWNADGRGVPGDHGRGCSYQKKWLTREKIEDQLNKQAGENKSMLTAEFDTLCRMALAALEQPGWQDIASAPKDGTTVQLAAAGIHAGRGHWVKERNWWARDIIGEQPTHWMPLPLPPTAGGEL